MSEQMNERSGGREQCRVKKSVSGASGPVLTSRFLAVLNRCTVRANQKVLPQFQCLGNEKRDLSHSDESMRQLRAFEAYKISYHTLDSYFIDVHTEGHADYSTKQF